MAAAIALLLAALVAAGCGLGPGKGLPDADLTVTEEFGAEPVSDDPVGDLTESDTVMRVLERNAKIATRYGGGFVQSIEGTGEAEHGGDPYDWFFYVNGVESNVGAADYGLHGGERIWWDYRDWAGAERVPAVVGSWPEPMLDGYNGKLRPVAVECMGGGAACALVRNRLEGAGVSISGGSPAGAIRFLVGPWAAVREDPAAAQIEAGPQSSGVFAEFARSGGAYRLRGLDESGEPAGPVLGPDAGLVAATRRYEAPPVWVVTGDDEAGAVAAAGLLDSADLRDHYAVATDGGAPQSLPTR
jgi:hypothetical protein